MSGYSASPTASPMAKRTFTVALEKLHHVLEVEHLSEEAKRHLKDVEELIRTVDQQINGQRRLNRRGTSQAEDLIKDVPTTESRRDLLLTFTEVDPDHADTHEVIARSPKKKMFGSMLPPSPSGAAQQFLARAGQFDFDALGYAEVCESPIRGLGGHLMVSSGLIKELNEACWLTSDEFEDRMGAFLIEINGQYRPEAIYHGAAHATDVMATVAWFLSLEGFAEHFSQMDYLMAYVAAAIHDVGHPGANNLFQSKIMSKLAIRYNDKSILENFHVALAFEKMQQPALNWFTLLEKDFASPSDEARVNLQQYVRRGLISMVLATDMAKHAAHIQELKHAVEKAKDGSQADKQAALDTKLLLLETVLHAADISNPLKPQNIMLAWTRRVLDEFWNQGDEEKSRALPISPLCDREAGRSTVPKGQLGFINFVIAPFFAPIVDLIPQAVLATNQLNQNKLYWEQKDKESASYEHIFSEEVE